MAIVENRATENGDVIRIETNVPIVGIVSLTAFADVVTGETGSTYFEKYFRYSRNGGLTFSDWIELTTINIQNIVIERVDYFIIEYRYCRTGTEAVDLAFDNVQVSGTYSPLTYPVFNSMIFSTFFTPNGVEVLAWAINVLEKLYKRGIVPAYVTRDAGGDDSDYVAYWFALTHFFAILVYYARQFENIQTNVALMREFVKGRGVYMRSDPDLEELYYVFNNYITEIQKRGTVRIKARTGDLVSGGAYYGGLPIGGDLIYAEADGELLRLLDALITDECLFALTLRGELGWCVGQSSPLYTGADNIINLIKGYEFTQAVEDLTKYPLINSDYVSLINSKINIIGTPAGASAGVGLTAFDTGILVMEPSLDYEISFRVQKSELTADLTFGVLLFDANGFIVNSVRITDGIGDDRFFERKALNRVNTEYWVRGVLHAYDAALIANDVMTIGFGQGLRAPSSARYLVPIIVAENSGGTALTDVIQISDVKVRPAALWCSRGFMSARNFIIGYLKNRNTEYNDAAVERIINEQLIPYNAFTLLKFL